ncbi:SMP-30/gluconolactonase/LRE family protein [Novosphingobium sp. TCA1]|uniref:SMP-30/gluconolactonase/LRE family protein n=1 Tax=Novosphingobium sp. TCA1 TaxID=2682474 RepID=UPI0013589A99|nr:SMP-30/gluconolactonase/LRE family protein [Novosphingobium sp. TCA1]
MMNRRSLLAALSVAPFLDAARVAAEEPAFGAVRRLDPGLDRIVAPGASVRRLASGFRWAEGPVWVPRENCLLFGDPPSNTVHRWSAKNGVEVFLRPSGLQSPVPSAIREAGLNGLALDGQGRLIAADSGSRGIVRIDLKSRARETLADRFEGKRFNSPNDLCVARSGDVYFTDPTYGFAEGDESPLRELPWCGLYRLSPGGKVDLLDRSHRRPNGVALSPDERTLYLSLSDEKQPEVLAYALDADGMPGDRRLFLDLRADLAAGKPGLPDGIKTGASGTVFATGPGGVHVCTAAGQALGVIETGKAVANCAIGQGGKSLFLTSADSLAVISLRSS